MSEYTFADVIVAPKELKVTCALDLDNGEEYQFGYYQKTYYLL